MEWERACNREQKEQRISEIVAATARLYKEYRFDEISFALIAKEAKFTRSNIYKYFNSKEEIFLELLKHDVVLLRKDLEKAYRKNKIYSVKEFASVWGKTLLKHERLLSLLTILFTSLEKNSSMQSLIDFKKKTGDELKEFSDLLCGVFPTLTSEKAAEFMHMQMALAIGLYSMANLSEVQKKAIEQSGTDHYIVDFGVCFQETVEYLLQGLLG